MDSIPIPRKIMGYNLKRYIIITYISTVCIKCTVRRLNSLISLFIILYKKNHSELYIVNIIILDISVNGFTRLMFNFLKHMFCISLKICVFSIKYNPNTYFIIPNSSSISSSAIVSSSSNDSLHSFSATFNFLSASKYFPCPIN